MLENKKNVLFDMDGLLIDSEALGIMMWKKYLHNTMNHLTQKLPINQ